MKLIRNDAVALLASGDCTDAQERSTQMVDEAEGDQPTAGTSLRVLVVDDELAIRDLLRSTVEALGHEVICVEDGHKAIKKVKEEPFDIVFLDMVIPGMDGLEILATIKKMNSDLPVVMMTGFSLEGEMQKAIKLGAVDCIYKTFDRVEGREVISRLLKKKE